MAETPTPIVEEGNGLRDQRGKEERRKADVKYLVFTIDDNGRKLVDSSFNFFKLHSC